MSEEIKKETELEQEPGMQEQPPTEQEAPEKSELELLSEKFGELNENYLRLRAEYDNFRKRSQKERDEIYPAATASALAKLLPVFDNIERAAAFPHGDDEFGKGFDLIHQSLGETLKNIGVEVISGEGVAFDPALHHAVMHTDDESLGENVVAQVLQRGYKLGDRVIRYAMVQTAN